MVGWKNDIKKKERKKNREKTLLNDNLDIIITSVHFTGFLYRVKLARQSYG